jgi:very-short-patch-repair endonuclease
MKNEIIRYKPYLKDLARELRNCNTKTEIMLWNKIKKKSLGCEFHRQVPLSDYIVDFFCHELMLAIEIDGSSHNYNFEKDEERENILKIHGIKTVRFEDKDVRFAINDVIRALEIIVEERIKELNIPPPLKGEA